MNIKSFYRFRTFSLTNLSLTMINNVTNKIYEKNNIKPQK